MTRQDWSKAKRDVDRGRNATDLRMREADTKPRPARIRPSTAVLHDDLEAGEVAVQFHAEGSEFGADWIMVEIGRAKAVKRMNLRVTEAMRLYRELGQLLGIGQ